ncbi:hypothetical protein [Brevibacterium sp. FME37]|uniref:hypothetical protein n=1 Tax=Brevibacterium sp. FME37 TaxID=2742607 RepID=UPI0018685287|nr:hypothetical protein [Brevibacterium sp. FME37]
MTFKGQIVCMFYPGAILFILCGMLLDNLPGLALGVGMLGAFLFIAWPIFTIVVHVRHERRLKRYLKALESEAVSITEARDPLHTFVASVESFILTIGLPVLFLGGLGIFCLVTADDDPGKESFKAFAGVGSLGLLGAYLLFLLFGRSQRTLRIAGVALAVFGLAGVFAVASVLGSEGITNVGDVVMAVASVVMTVLGIWLAITGRNTFKRED